MCIGATLLTFLQSSSGRRHGWASDERVLLDAQFVDNVLTPYPGVIGDGSQPPLLSSNADGIHSVGASYGPIIEGNTLANMGDDAISVHGMFTLVVKVTAAHVNPAESQTFLCPSVSGRDRPATLVLSIAGKPQWTSRGVLWSSSSDAQPEQHLRQVGGCLQTDEASRTITVATGNANGLGISSKIGVYEGDQLLMLGTTHITAVKKVPFSRMSGLSFAAVKMRTQHLWGGQCLG